MNIVDWDSLGVQRKIKHIASVCCEGGGLTELGVTVEGVEELPALKRHMVMTGIDFKGKPRAMWGENQN